MLLGHRGRGAGSRPPPYGLKDGVRYPKSRSGHEPCRNCAIRKQHDTGEVGCKINEHAWIAAATVSVVQAISGWLRVGGYDQASIREAKKACGCGNGTCDWAPAINWRIPSNLPTAMAHRRRLDARAHALPENSPIWE